jgi:sigma54-dependent transcription regulator
MAETDPKVSSHAPKPTPPQDRVDGHTGAGLQRWEYQQLILSGATHEKVKIDRVDVLRDTRSEWFLNQLGEQGWEVVSYWLHLNLHTFTLKRPK